MKDGNAFLRKVQVRKFAIDNSWRGSPMQASSSNQWKDEDQRRWDALLENLQEADGSKFNNGYFPLHSHRRVLGPAIIFCKMAVRKLIKIFFGWYLFPIYERQSHYNGKIVNVVSLEKDLLYALNEQVKASRDEIAALRAELAALRKDVGRAQDLPTDDEQFYHEFEERFRGSRDEIRERLQIYIPYIKEHLPDWSKGRFIDVGSGRGEWLDILKENGASDYIGVDLNDRQNEVAGSFGHRTVCEDCVQYLSRQPDGSVDLITGFQIIEHLCMSDLMELFRQSRRVLKKGGMILFETPNPASLTVGADTFYKDPTHKRPLNSAMTAFCAEWYGFKEVRIIEANNSHPNCAGLSLEGRNERDVEDIKKINEVFWQIYGPGDYAVFGIKE